MRIAFLAALAVAMTSMSEAVAAPAAPAAASGDNYGHYFIVRPSTGEAQNMALGDEYKITQGMTTQPKKDIFSQYYFQLLFNVKVGDRYRISWYGAEPISLEYAHGRAYETKYPDKQIIFNKAGSVEISFKTAGRQTLTFSQMGLAYSNESSGGLAGANIGAGTPRAFQTVYLKVVRA